MRIGYTLDLYYRDVGREFDSRLNGLGWLTVCGQVNHFGINKMLGMGFPVRMGIPWEWELMTKLGMGRNGKQPAWEWE